MAVKLELHFTGLCAFVPKKPIDQDTNHATVLLVNARRSPHGAHHSLLLAEPDFYPDVHLSVNNRPAANRFQFDKPPIVTVKTCVLSGEQISIVGLKSDGTRVLPPPNTLTFVHGHRGTDTCPSFSNQYDFEWVLTNPGTVNSNLLTCFDCGDIVGMRMLLTSGSLRNDLFRHVDNNILKWHFGSQLSAAAEEVVYELSFADATGVTSIALESIPFDGSPTRPPLVLSTSRTDGLIEAWIVNMPPGDLLGLSTPLRFERNHHYQEFYRLGTSASQPIPVPDPTDFCEGFIAISNPKCPPTQFAPPSTLAEVSSEVTDHCSKPFGVHES